MTTDPWTQAGILIGMLLVLCYVYSVSKRHKKKLQLTTAISLCLAAGIKLLGCSALGKIAEFNQNDVMSMAIGGLACLWVSVSSIHDSLK